MKKKKYNVLNVGDYSIIVDDCGYDYVLYLQKKIRDVEDEKSKLEKELKSIKPIIQSERYKPAISTDCGDCKYCVRSPWNNEIIGCRKDIVCNDFIQKGE